MAAPTSNALLATPPQKTASGQPGTDDRTLTLGGLWPSLRPHVAVEPSDKHAAAAPARRRHEHASTAAANAPISVGANGSVLTRLPTAPKLNVDMGLPTKSRRLRRLAPLVGRSAVSTMGGRGLRDSCRQAGCLVDPRCVKPWLSGDTTHLRFPPDASCARHRSRTSSLDKPILRYDVSVPPDSSEHEL